MYKAYKGEKFYSLDKIFPLCTAITRDQPATSFIYRESLRHTVNKLWPINK